jgi:uncharacterized membrane protein
MNAPPADPGGPRPTGSGVAERVRAFDLARGLAVAFMVLVHVLWHWGRPDTVATPLGTAISFLGGPPAAPVFMTLMGASLAFSSRAEPRPLVIRGLVLIAGGYLLNLARGALPATLGLATGVVTAEEIAPFTPLRLLTSVDILQLAGCSLMAIAALRVAGRPAPAWLVVGLGLVMAAPAVHGWRIEVPLIDAVLTPIWGDAPNVFYAVFPWAMYPIVGAVTGEALARSEDRAATMRSIGLAGAALCGGGIVAILVTRPDFDVATYWRHPPAYAAAILGFVLAWTWACAMVVGRLPNLGVLRFLERAGRRVTVLYVVHWLIVGWGVGLVGFRALELGPLVAAMAATAALTWLVGTRLPVGRRAAGAGA